MYRIPLFCKSWGLKDLVGDAEWLSDGAGAACRWENARGVPGALFDLSAERAEGRMPRDGGGKPFVGEDETDGYRGRLWLVSAC